MFEQGDDMDEHLDADIDFDQFFTCFDKNEEEPEPIQALLLPDPIVIEEEQQEEQLNPSVLPKPTTTATSVTEKRSAFTPSTPATPQTKTKKLKVAPQDSADEQDSMPSYLSHAEKKFDEIITPHLSEEATPTTSTVLMEEFRQMALLEHQQQLANIDLTLWTAYLRSGTATLKQAIDEEKQTLFQPTNKPQVDEYPCVWPKRLRSTMISDSELQLQKNSNIDHDTYLNYVNQKLTRLNAQIRSYRIQRAQRIKRVQPNFTPEIERVMTEFVEEHGIALYRIVHEGLVAAVKYNYLDRMSELEFQREDVNNQHVCLRLLSCLLTLSRSR